MERSRFLVFAVVVSGAIFAAACGGGSSDFCHLGSTMQSKMGSCATTDGGTAQCSSSDVSNCETALGKCSSSDQTALNNYATCVAGQPACTNVQTWSADLATKCASQLTAVLAATACLQQIGAAISCAGGSGSGL